jgi:Response regulator containing CheY-like receiver domain and AraC-type DNA-binding domain
MTIIQFHALPLPHYINSGHSLAGPGRKHPERVAIGEFDLIVVKQGCMYIGEEERTYEVREGHALLLRPDLHHYPTAGCKELTSTYWLHFQTAGPWSVCDGAELQEEEFVAAPFGENRMPRIKLAIPQFVKLRNAADLYPLLHQLVMMERDSHRNEVRWEQQLLFQEVLRRLAASASGSSTTSPAAEAADRAASYLREHYRSRITADELGAAINFHPVYVARCMRQHFGCAPMEYLLLYRLEQAKRLLLQTDLSIRQIAEESGFLQAAYFTACFRKREGCTPREYRKTLSLRSGTSSF